MVKADVQSVHRSLGYSLRPSPPVPSSIISEARDFCSPLSFMLNYGLLVIGADTVACRATSRNVASHRFIKFSTPTTGLSSQYLPYVETKSYITSRNGCLTSFVLVDLA